MQEDNLSDKYKMVYDELSGEYVVSEMSESSPRNTSTYPGRDSRLAPRPAKTKKEVKRQGFLSRLFQSEPSPAQPPPRTPRPPMPPPPPRPPMPPRPPFPPPRPPRPPVPPFPVPPGPNPAVRLSREIYVKLDGLVEAYRNLQRFEGSDARELRELETQALIMRATMANIHRALSGRALPPANNSGPELGLQYCIALGRTADYASEISRDMIRLMRLVSIQNIDRQLLILNATISSQERTLRTLRTECVAREAGDE